MPTDYRTLIMLGLLLSFIFKQTGSYVATRQLIDLEDRFENEVIARRHRATLNDPVRQPPERPALSDTGEQQ